MLKYALDIGSHNIRLIAGSLKSGSIEVKGCLSSPTEGYFGGVVVDNRKLLFSVLKVTREFTQKYGIRPKSVLLNCSNQFMRLHHLKGKFQRREPDIPIRKKELEKFKQDLLRDRISLDEKELFVDVDGYKIDEQKGIVNPEGMLAKCVEISLKVITMPVSIYNNFLSVIGEAGIEVEALIPEILAKAWVLTSREERRAGIMVVDLGWGC
jgi:cell division protein FtsA